MFVEAEEQRCLCMQQWLSWFSRAGKQQLLGERPRLSWYAINSFAQNRGKIEWEQQSAFVDFFNIIISVLAAGWEIHPASLRLFLNVLTIRAPFNEVIAEQKRNMTTTRVNDAVAVCRTINLCFMCCLKSTPWLLAAAHVIHKGFFCPVSFIR